MKSLGESLVFGSLTHPTPLPHALHTHIPPPRTASVAINHLLLTRTGLHWSQLKKNTDSLIIELTKVFSKHVIINHGGKVVRIESDTSQH